MSEDKKQLVGFSPFLFCGFWGSNSDFRVGSELVLLTNESFIKSHFCLIGNSFYNSFRVSSKYRGLTYIDDLTLHLFRSTVCHSVYLHFVLFNNCVCVTFYFIGRSMYVCAPCPYLLHLEVTRGYQILWNWSYSCELPCGC